MASARSLGGSGTPAGTSSATLVGGSSDPGYSKCNRRVYSTSNKQYNYGKLI